MHQSYSIFSYAAFKAAALLGLKIAPALVVAAGMAQCAWGAEDIKASKPDEYDYRSALKSPINPHEQINDEGELLQGACIICHTNVPDVTKEKSVKDVKLHMQDDLTALCYRCHVVKHHPGSDPAFAISTGGVLAKSHLIVPPPGVILNIRLALKDYPAIVPLDPKSGKITCITCHNPHERGVNFGRADYGADSRYRLRTAGSEVCVYCHRK